MAEMMFTEVPHDEMVPALQPRFAFGRGLRLIAENGVEFLDGVSGTFNLPLGYDDPRVVEAGVGQVRQRAPLRPSYSAPYAQARRDGFLSASPRNPRRGWMRGIARATAH